LGKLLLLNAMSGFYPVGHLSGLGAAALVSRTQREHDPTQVVRSPLLEEFRANSKGNKRYELKDIYRLLPLLLALNSSRRGLRTTWVGSCSRWVRDTRAAAMSGFYPVGHLSGLGAAALVSRTQREHDPTQVVGSCSRWVRDTRAAAPRPLRWPTG
jgi:hypothetical protein